MSRFLVKCMPLLQSYCSIKSTRKRALFFKHFEECIPKAAQEMSLNTLRGNVHMTRHQKAKLKRYKNALVALSQHKVPKYKRRRIILQSGSGLLPLLLPLVLSAVSAIKG